MKKKLILSVIAVTMVCMLLVGFVGFAGADVYIIGYSGAGTAVLCFMEEYAALTILQTPNLYGNTCNITDGYFYGKGLSCTGNAYMVIWDDDGSVLATSSSTYFNNYENQEHVTFSPPLNITVNNVIYAGIVTDASNYYSLCVSSEPMFGPSGYESNNGVYTVLGSGSFDPADLIWHDNLWDASIWLLVEGDEPVPTPTPEPTETPEPTAEPSESPTPTPTATPTASSSVSPSVTPIGSVTPTPTPFPIIQLPIDLSSYTFGLLFVLIGLLLLLLFIKKR